MAQTPIIPPTTMAEDSAVVNVPADVAIVIGMYSIIENKENVEMFVKVTTPGLPGVIDKLIPTKSTIRIVGPCDVIVSKGVTTIPMGVYVNT